MAGQLGAIGRLDTDPRGKEHDQDPESPMHERDSKNESCASPASPSRTDGRPGAKFPPVCKPDMIKQLINVIAHRK